MAAKLWQGEGDKAVEDRLYTAWRGINDSF